MITIIWNTLTLMSHDLQITDAPVYCTLSTLQIEELRFTRLEVFVLASEKHKNNYCNIIWYSKHDMRP